jgi:hypothetical protein
MILLLYRSFGLEVNKENSFPLSCIVKAYYLPFLLLLNSFCAELSSTAAQAGLSRFGRLKYSKGRHLSSGLINFSNKGKEVGGNKLYGCPVN